MVILGDLQFLVNAISAIFLRFALLPGLLLAFCLASGQAVFAQAPRPRFRSDRLIIMPKQGSASSDLRKLHQGRGRRVLSTYRHLRDLQVLQLAPGESLEEAAENYMSSGLVEFAEPDYKLHATAVPNDPAFDGGSQWSLRNSASPGHDISAVAAWDTLTSASNIIVAVVDSGIRVTHQDLAANLWTNSREIADNGTDDDGNGVIDDVHGFNAIDGSGDITDEAGHGTHVAGIIGAVGNNGVGISGVAWKVQLMACKFLDATGNGDTSDAIKCIEYARANHANIINASWGGGDFSQALFNEISFARAAGIIFVTAAGNDSVNIDMQPIYPASYNLDNIVVVGGSTRADTVDTSYSSFGPLSVDLFAPGTGIYSTWNTWDGAYTNQSGTSMAVPHVTGALALMKARFASMTYSQIIARLLGTVDVLPAFAGKCKTGGRLNLARALGSDPTANFTASKLSGEPPLSVTFTNLTLGSVSSVNWDFGDGTPQDTNRNPSHVFAANGIFDVRLTVIGINGRTNSFDQKIQVASNYEFVPEDYSWIDPTGMDTIGLADNGVAPAQLPFDFTFYGQIYDSIYIGGNGLLGFDPTGMETTVNASLPLATAPNGIICPYWDNLNPAAGGNVYAGVVGDAPSRKYVVSWVNVPRVSTAVNLTFQAILEEGSNQIVFQYLETQPTTTRGGGRRATIGVEDQTGTVAALYLYNGVPRTLTNQMAIRIRPKGYRYLVVKNSPVQINAVIGSDPTGVSGSLHLINPGNLPLAWTLSSSDSWIALPQTRGTLVSGRDITVPINLSSNAGRLAEGTYNGSLTLKNTTDGAGDSAIPVVLLVEQPKAVLTLSNAGSLGFEGGLGGPFTPSKLTVQLQNTGNVYLNWGSSVDSPWLTVAPSRGGINPGQMQLVQIALNTAATNLTSGTNTAIITFQNKTDPDDLLKQPVTVDVRSHVEQTSASLANGIFSGTLTVPTGSSYQVEFSSDLQNWVPLDVTPQVSGSTLNFQDTLTADDQRFYRVRVQP